MREARRAYYSAEIAVDHITDHLPFRSIRKQWTGERRRARFSRRKGAEKAIFSGNCLHRSVWEQDAGCSSHLTPTKKKTESRACALLSVFCYYVSPTARFAILYRPSVAIVVVVVTVCSAGISEDTPAPSVASSAIGTVSVFLLSAAVRASARSTPVVSAKEASSSIILFACVFSPILFSPKITLKLLKTTFVNFANGFPSKNTAARHSAAVFLLFLILHKSESRMRNIKYQHKQDKQHNACKTPKQSCNPGILFSHLVFVKGNHIFIEFFVRHAIC